MSETRDQGLAALTADVLSADRPDPELLVRYAQDPNSLSADERGEIEHHLAHTRGAAAQLAILRRMLAAAPSVRAAPAPAAPARAAPRRPRFSSRWIAGAGGIAAAAAAALVVGLRWTGGSDPARTDPQLQQQAENSAADAGARSGGETPRSAEPGPAAQPAPREQERIQLAALILPDYQRPAGAGERPRLGSATRGASQDIRVEALVPDHVGRTLSSTPELDWFISKAPGSGSELQLTLALEQSSEAASSARLPLPARAGIQRISLAELGMQLAPGRRYRWSVLLRGPAAGETGFASAQGFIERIEPGRELQERLSAGSDGERVAIYAQSGLWYDALGAVLERRAAAPEDPSAARALQALLDSAGLAALQGR